MIAPIVHDLIEFIFNWYRYYHKDRLLKLCVSYLFFYRKNIRHTGRNEKNPEEQ